MSAAGSLLFAGCPYIFGPPNTSGVPDTGESAVTVPPTTDTGETGTLPLSPTPTLTSISVTPENNRYLVGFSVADGDGDLSGGNLTLAIGVDVRTYRFPDDLLFWAPTGTSVAVWDDVIPCSGVSRSWTAVVNDAAGHTSAQTIVDSTVTGLGTLTESGNVDLGVVNLPATVCGSVDSPQDEDPLVWQPAADASATVVLWWTGDGLDGADLDLYLSDALGNPLTESWGTSYPEQLSYAVLASSTYVLDIDHWDGPQPVGWQVLLR